LLVARLRTYNRGNNLLGGATTDFEPSASASSATPAQET
jgi:hypothetical protein